MSGLFECPPIRFPGGVTMHPQVTDAVGRIQRVRDCNDPDQLRAELGNLNLQKTVRQAIERRLRALA